MNPVAERILEQALHPAADRGRIAERLIGSLETDTQVETVGQRKLQHRRRALENGELTLLSSGGVSAKLRIRSDARD